MSPVASGPRIALFSRRAMESKVWHASQYEFEDIIAEVDSVELVTPAGVLLTPAGSLLHGAVNRVRRRLGLPRRSAMRPVTTAFDAELFFGIFAAPHEIGALTHIRPQLARSARKVAFIIEMYTTDLPKTADYIKQLRGFDHIFVFTRDVLPHVERLTGVPTTFLATGVDALLFAPPENAPARTIDVSSYGRRLGPTHAGLRQAAAENTLHYRFDTVRGPFDVSEYREHREALAAQLQRSRYAVVYKNNDEPKRIARTAGEETLTNRFFETTAAGAVVLGSAPDVADFVEHFNWTDAVIDLPAPAPGIAGIIADLDRDPQRVESTRLAGIRAGLLRHDWAYRWREVLAAVGMIEHPRVEPRLEELRRRAQALDTDAPLGQTSDADGGSTTYPR